MRILAIETSCDETAAAVVEDRSRILSNRVASQVDVHRAFGGVVPELASRCHVETIEPLVRLVLGEAGVTVPQLDAVAVTHGPGLIGALLVGLSFAKSLAFVHDKPVIGVNHLEGHIRAAFLENPEIAFPAIALVVSGGHTALYLMPREAEYQLLAKTRDDAAGEAYDKVAKLLGLGYPGGPIVDRIAKTGDDRRVALPIAKMADGSFDFSFSGLKTAVLRFAQAEGIASGWRRHDRDAASEPVTSIPISAVPVPAVPVPAVPIDEQTRHDGVAIASQKVEAPGASRATAEHSSNTPAGPVHVEGVPGETPRIVRDLCASFQRAAVETLVQGTIRAAQRENVRSVILSGGVACNSRLRADLGAACASAGIAFHLPSPRFCTDNAAMIAAAAFLHLERGRFDSLALAAEPALRLGTSHDPKRTPRHK